MTECVQIGDCTLYRGDCLDILPTLGKIGSVVTDPPYAIPTQVASGRSITRNVGDLSIVESAFRLHFAAWKEAIGEDGRAFVFCDGASYPVVYRAAYGRFNLASLIWDKQQIGMGREFRKQHEFILHAWGAQTPVVPSDGVGVADIIRCRPVPPKDRVHPAQKPVGVLRSLLRVCSGPVVDPFMGSAATALACLETGVPFIGIEIEPQYFDLACRRVETAARIVAAPPQKPKQEAML